VNTLDLSSSTYVKQPWYQQSKTGGLYY